MSNPELEKDEYDVVVLGTGLGESITAAALAKAGKSVLHLDPNDYYGAAQASLTLDELVAWSDRQHGESSSSSSSNSNPDPSSYSRSSYTPLTPSLEKDRRRYALSLFSAVLPSRGDLIDVLVKSDVSRYVSFRMLDSISIYDQDKLRRVPGSKEEVFKDKSITLLEKRKIMKFLMFAAGEYESDDLYTGKEEVGIKQFLQESFGLSSELADAVGFAIAHCSSVEDKTGPTLARTRRYLRSVGRYGSGAFLVGQYGGAGEVAQGFCRACAVFGGTYVLGSSAAPSSITVDETIWLEIPCHPRPISAKHLITSTPSHLPEALRPRQRRVASVARCIAILDELPPLLRRATAEDEETKEEDDTAIIVFPPEHGRESVVRALIMGEGTGSCPAGQFVIYLSTVIEFDADPKDILEPFLRRLSPTALFESYHLIHHYEVQKSITNSIVLLSPYRGLDSLTEGLDWEAAQGKKAYSAVMGNEEEQKEFFEKLTQEEEEADEL